MLCVQVFADSSFHATASSSPRRTISTMDDLRAEMERAKDGFARAEVAARTRARTPAAVQHSRFREDALTQAAKAKTENLTRLRSATAAAGAPAPAQPSAGVALLRREMADVKGQPQLMKVIERLVKATERQKRRDAQQPAPDAPRKLPNLNMVFGGPPGTGKTSSVRKIAKVLAAPEVGVLKHAKVVELNKETQLPKGDTVPQRVGKVFASAKGSILFLDEAHKRTDSQAFVDALVPLLSKHEGEVMVVIAGYKDKIMKWLRNSDIGKPYNPNPPPPDPTPTRP